MPCNKRPITRRNRTRARATAAGSLMVLFLAGPLANSAQAAAVVVPLGTSSAFSVLAGSTVTNTGTTTIERSVGVAPGTAITGASTMTIGGTYHSADQVALDAKNDLTTAYNNAKGQTPRNAEDAELGGETLVGGIYNRPAEMGLTGPVPLTLDGGNGDNSHSDSVWVFQAGTTLITGSASSIVLTRGADACNVFWQVGSSATFGTGSTFVGTVMADQSITMNTGATLQGRVLARVAAVNLHANVITTPDCAGDVGVPPGTSTPPTTGGTGGTGGTGTGGTGGAGNGGGNGGTGNAGGGGTGTGDTDQVEVTPAGAVDTGYAGPVSTSHHGPSALAVSATTLVALVGGLALVAVRRRRLM